MVSPAPEIAVPEAIEAERAVIGCAMQSASALADAAQVLNVSDFYNPGHATVFGALLDLRAAGVKPDPMVLFTELRRINQLERVGGGTYLHTLMATPATAVNVTHFARVVRHASRARLVLQVHQRLGQALHEQVNDPDGLMTAVAHQAIALELLADEQAFDAPVKGLSAVREFLEQPDDPLDWIIPGAIERQDVMMLLSTEGGGKALAVDTPILTDRGWLMMGEIKEGDSVFAPSGELVRVRAATAVMRERPCYRVSFSDGSSIVADAQHLWQTQDYQERMTGSAASIRTTEQIASTLRARDGHCLNHSIEVAAPIEYPGEVLPVAPYTFGAWLGDGTSVSAAFTCAEPELIRHIERDGYAVSPWTARYQWTIRGIQVSLRELGVLGAKHIPEVYLRGSVAQRTALLQGLMDTDGSASDGRGVGRGSGCSKAELTLTCPRLIQDALELIRGLGYQPRVRESRARLNGRDIGPRWRVTFRAREDTFRLTRKRERVVALRTNRSRRRFITAVEPVETVPVRCIELEDPRGMYLAGRELIPTHNSWLCRQICLAVAVGLNPFRPDVFQIPQRTLLIDLENAPSMLRRESRPLAAKVEMLAGVKLSDSLVWTRPEGLNLRERKDALLLERVVAESGAALVGMGSLYKAFRRSGDDWDTAAGEVRDVLDKIRSRYNCAFILEHHMPKGSGGSERPQTAYGSSEWTRWASVGRIISKAGDNLYEFNDFRGDRGVRDLPPALARGGELPWTSVWDEAEIEECRWPEKKKRSATSVS